VNPEAHATPHGEDDSRSVTELFHRLNSVFPTDQHVISVLPETPVQVALDLLGAHGFSQLPVMIGQQVIGIFSYRSFSQAVIRLSTAPKIQKFDPQGMFVEDCIERPIYARVTDEFRSWFDAIDRQDALLVGDPNRLQGIVTAMDILRYLYDVASPFVTIAEIELSLRALIRMAVDRDKLLECARACLKHYAEDKFPASIEHMSFNDYVQIIGDGRNWHNFEPIFKGDRVRTRAKLEQVRDLRNDVFHFRRELTDEDHETLSMLREWMLMKATAAEARREGGVS
jgi:CBS domain-containing protein